MPDCILVQVVGCETALANGYVDVIAVDQDGLITIIECKLDRNPEVKRKVIGQVLYIPPPTWTPVPWLAP